MSGQPHQLGQERVAFPASRRPNRASSVGVPPYWSGSRRSLATLAGRRHVHAAAKWLVDSSNEVSCLTYGLLDAARDRIGRIADTQRSEQDAQLNEITKKLAAWAAIIAVPTAVTGFYGQNIPYPGFGRYSGFISSCIVMIVLAGSLYWLLRRNDWL